MILHSVTILQIIMSKIKIKGDLLYTNFVSQKRSTYVPPVRLGPRTFPPANYWERMVPRLITRDFIPTMFM